ncbi:MarR family winged helix-turn-helix transcriptional regulator [Poseidonocella sp. HB161398]|uniref:MarR family winged helix-turn-helix transcriptional regulator n=1 Tax=Poseidonocella sp. HB161398 TaxID=2320855 RepID=UPI0011084D5D|nr:MarR family winged helix-turn-helix transcriptional regulator [Poseidonocella sp. HB161398]
MPRKDPPPDPEFNLENFLPYLLNQAAERTSEEFHEHYRAEYDLTRTQWRVVANLGRFGSMAAAEICRISHIEKTAVSRAVSVLEGRGLLSRSRDAADKRQESLTLTPAGTEVFRTLGKRAIDYDDRLRNRLGPHLSSQLEAMLRQLILAAGHGDGDA